MLYLGEKIINLSGMVKVYFCNFGIEVNEIVFKIVRKYSSDKYGNGRGIIISLKDFFYGRIMMFLMVIGMDKYYKYFYFFFEGFKYIERNNIEDLKNNFDFIVCVIIFEVI